MITWSIPTPPRFLHLALGGRVTGVQFWRALDEAARADAYDASLPIVCDARSAGAIGTPLEIERSLLFTAVAFHCGPTVLLTGPHTAGASEIALADLLWMACRREPARATRWPDAIRAVGIYGDVPDPTHAPHR